MAEDVPTSNRVRQVEVVHPDIEGSGFVAETGLEHFLQLGWRVKDDDQEPSLFEEPGETEQASSNQDGYTASSDQEI